jgi:CheY-like chemotaxis protein
MARKILVGDDRLDFARREFGKYFPDSEVLYADTPEGLLALAEQHPDADMIVTDLQYTFKGKEGLQVLSALEGDPREVYLWTASTQFHDGVEALKLGAEGVIPKDKLGEFAGYSEGPAKAGPPQYEGDILVVVPQSGPAVLALKKIMGFMTDDSRMTVIPSRGLKTVEGTFERILYITDFGDEKGSAKGFIDHEDKYRDVPLGYKEIIEVPVAKAVAGILEALFRKPPEDAD